MLGSVAATSVRDLASRMLSPGVPAVLVAAAASGGMALLGAGGAVATDWQPLSEPVAWMLGGSVVAVILGYVGSVSAMRVGQIAALMPFRYTALLIAIVLGVVAFGTVPDTPTLLGAGVVVATGLVTILRDRRRPRPEEEATPGA
jgi:S-adenosylmethionine uptake transporter